MALVVKVSTVSYSVSAPATHAFITNGIPFPAEAGPHVLTEPGGTNVGVCEDEMNKL